MRLFDGDERLEARASWGSRQERFIFTLTPGQRRRFSAGVIEPRVSVKLMLLGVGHSVIDFHGVRLGPRLVHAGSEILQDEYGEIHEAMLEAFGQEAERGKLNRKLKSMTMQTRVLEFESGRGGELVFQVVWNVIVPREDGERLAKGMLVEHELFGTGHIKSKGPVMGTYLVHFRGDPAARMVSRRSIARKKLLRKLRKA